eukprot:TRINITY_DN63274_c0_g1_i1.p1 TRINITY_DN63274_c0_g1~~TRINITY_DN63274_c0_g1_i1.p1  ORF type:complete len:433 (+),score=123.86 TRINITY_DN63274_c0_g1_i1:71-1300(+)
MAKKGAGGGKKKKGGGVQVISQIKAKGGGKGRGKASSGGTSGDGTSARRQLRQEHRQAARAGRGQKRAHGKEQAVEETRQRLRLKVLQRQLLRGPASKPCSERRSVLLELGRLQAEAARQRLAIEHLQEALNISPDDEDFLVRTPLLCLYVDAARSEDAAALLKGPLFQRLLEEAGTSSKRANAAKQAAITVGCYSIALLSYISVYVIREHRKSQALKSAEERLIKRIKAARSQNPFVAEFLAFSPAFEPVFPLGCDLPPPSPEATEEELAMLEALQYCCGGCGRGQSAVWLDADDQIRKFLRETLFEEDEEPPAADAKEDVPVEETPPPLAPLPPPFAREPEVISRWRRAREEAMDLWATEMAADAGLDAKGAEGLEGGEEEHPTDDDCQGASDGDDALGEAEDRRFG